MKSLIAILCVTSLCLFASACGDGTDSSSGSGYGTPGGGPASQPSATPPTTVNTICPIMGEKVDPEITADFQGKKVGFCCPKCIDKWNGMTDAEKLAKLK